MRRGRYKIDNFRRADGGRYFGPDSRPGCGLAFRGWDWIRGLSLRHRGFWAGSEVFFRFLCAFLSGVVAFLGVTVCKGLCFQMRRRRYKIDNILRASGRTVLLSRMRAVGPAPRANVSSPGVALHARAKLRRRTCSCQRCGILGARGSGRVVRTSETEFGEELCEGAEVGLAPDGPVCGAGAQRRSRASAQALVWWGSGWCCGGAAPVSAESAGAVRSSRS